MSEVITDESQTCKGRAKKNMGEARMDIEDSEMGYLGYHGSESYGLTWKVRQEQRGFPCTIPKRFLFNVSEYAVWNRSR